KGGLANQKRRRIRQFLFTAIPESARSGMRQCGLIARTLLHSQCACRCQRKNCLAECCARAARNARTEPTHRTGNVELRREYPEDDQDCGVENSDAACGC